MVRNLRKITALLLVLVLLSPILSITKSLAVSERYELSFKWFYIKNAYSGRYLDVNGGIGANGRNVEQHGYHGGYNQKWYLYHAGNGEYWIATEARK